MRKTVSSSARSLALLVLLPAIASPVAGPAPSSGHSVAALSAIAPSAPTSAPDPTRSATIHRDAWGTPHVFADTDEGAVFGMAWALAEDDWPLIEGNYLHALGRYAERVGEEGVADDWMARALEIVPLSVEEYEGASPRLTRLLDAYAAGLNAWLASRPPDDLDVLERVEPWYPLALIRYKYYQNEFLGYAGLRWEWAERARTGGWPAAGAAPPAPGGDAAPSPRYFDAQFDGLGFRPQGSNEWALAPSRTASGRAMLLINPHQSFVGVQRYAEIHLESREGLRFSGLTVFGFLLPYMGHNEALGWAYTDNYADHSDLYAEAFDDPAHPLRYRYGDGWREAERWTDSIRVRTPGGLETRTFAYVRTHHGPVVGVDDEGRPLAVRMARYEEGGWFDQWDAMIRAHSMAEWKAAAGMLRVAYMNAMYADRDGNIGYVYGSAVPKRLPGVDPGGILDGSDPRTEWQGWHSFDELPQVWNPPSGWLLNTNSTPFTATVDLPFDRGDFPPYMVGTESDNARARRSRQVLERLRSVTLDDFARAVWDTHLVVADEVVPELSREWQRVRARELSAPGGLTAADETWADAVRAIDRLERWDRVADTGSVETTWFVLTAEERARAREERWTPALVRTLDALRKRWGTTEVAWGRINRHQRPLPGEPVGLDPDRPSLPAGGASGGFGSVFSYYSRPVDGPAGLRIGTAGNSYVSVIEFGPGPEARSVLNYGQSGDPDSPHFFDQAELYVGRRFKPAWFGRDAVEANAERSYTVGVGGARR